MEQGQEAFYLILDKDDYEQFLKKANRIVDSFCFENGVELGNDFSI